MNYLIKKYKKMSHIILNQYGFQSYRNNHYRVVNDVFQSLHLHRSISGNNCTIEFTVVPLCIGNIIVKTFCGADHLKMFENNYSWFSYDRNDQKSMDECVDLMFEYVKKYLIPYFENANNSKDAYYETCDFQHQHDKEGILLADYSLFCMALKSGLYDKALEHLIARKKHAENAYKRNKECFGNLLKSEYEQKMVNKITEIEEQIKMILEENSEDIDHFIVENEKSALFNLGLITNT